MMINIAHKSLSLLQKKELELRIETQKQTLQSRDESIKKLLEMLQNKGTGESITKERKKNYFQSMHRP